MANYVEDNKNIFDENLVRLIKEFFYSSQLGDTLGLRIEKGNTVNHYTIKNDGS